MTGSLGLCVALFLFGLIVFICVLLNDASSKRGVPMLLAFILFGMVCGNVRSIPIYLDDSGLAERICTVALVFIMFYGGFGTSWKSARKVAVESGLLATAGVVITALVTGLFCHFALKWEWAESLLLGAVLSSTDAASVFSILRSNKLGLKNNTAPILEVESGSNDPAAYMLTAVMISIINGGADGGSVALMVLAQIGLGTVFGLLIAQGGIAIMRKLSFSTSGFDSLLVLAIAITRCDTLGHDIFSIVFCVVLISIGLEGTLIPWAARKLEMIDDDSDIMKTFSDFAEETALHFSRIDVAEGEWDGKSLAHYCTSNKGQVLMIMREGRTIVPNGATVLRGGDILYSHTE